MIPVVVPDARVVAADTAGAYRVLTFASRAIAEGARPGQFVNIAVGDGCGLLRRPFSVYRVDRTLGTVSVAFDAIGEGTRWLAVRAPDDTIDVVGALGHGFEVPDPRGADLIVGGGYGSAALAYLADELAQRGREVHAILGARSSDRIFRDDLIDASCATVTVTTDDGSAGVQGLVTDALPEIARAHDVTTVYACGPNRMLAAVGELCANLGIASQLAVEEFMACGIGVCWTCVLPVRRGDAIAHQRSCTEGPVFEGAAVAWA
ncbi:MAG TPA: dihydroorotate dehydrogenase electron transfer subunit [Actinomycetota bacterium]|nr:dihydroorotate dehydrogenase electron transfer subunit [Actinomycetota bacterium]